MIKQVCAALLTGIVVLSTPNVDAWIVGNLPAAFTEPAAVPEEHGIPAPPPADSGSLGYPVEEAEEDAENAGPPAEGEPDPLQEQSGDRPATSAMALLPQDAGRVEMLEAFEADYARAERLAGVEGALSGLTYQTEDPGTAIVQIDRVTLRVSPPSVYDYVWFNGYPPSEEWVRREIRLVVMAADDTLSPQEAEDFTNRLYQRAWDNRNNMPRSVMEDLPSGLSCALSLDNREMGLVAFSVHFQR